MPLSPGDTAWLQRRRFGPPTPGHLPSYLHTQDGRAAWSSSRCLIVTLTLTPTFEVVLIEII